MKAAKSSGLLPAAVVDDELLSEKVGQARRHHARHHIRRPAGGHRNDDPDRLVRVALRGCERWQQRNRETNPDPAQNVDNSSRLEPADEQC